MEGLISVGDFNRNKKSALKQAFNKKRSAFTGSECHNK